VGNHGKSFQARAKLWLVRSYSSCGMREGRLMSNVVSIQAELCIHFYFLIVVPEKQYCSFTLVFP
jgi:hypothetical protein